MTRSRAGVQPLVTLMLTGLILSAPARGATPAPADPFIGPVDREPAFELRALGVLGGDIDTNLSCYLLTRMGEPSARVMIDGGSILPGIFQWKEDEGLLGPGSTWSEKTRAALPVLKALEALLVTHAHMDHIGGFVQKSTMDILFAMEGKAPLAIVAMPPTIDAFRDLLMRPPLWIDLSAVPPKSPAVAFRPLAPGDWARVGPFEVRAIPLNHPVPCAAFLIRVGGAAYVHLGDTGATQEVWEAARPFLTQDALRAVSVEVSWPARRERTARDTGHLTRSSLLLELNKLARAHPGPLPAAEAMTDAQALSLARRLAPSFRRCPIMIVHIKALEYDEAYRELSYLKMAGLNLIMPRTGALLRF